MIHLRTRNHFPLIGLQINKSTLQRFPEWFLSLARGSAWPGWRSKCQKCPWAVTGVDSSLPQPQTKCPPLYWSDRRHPDLCLKYESWAFGNKPTRAQSFDSTSHRGLCGTIQRRRLQTTHCGNRAMSRHAAHVDNVALRVALHHWFIGLPDARDDCQHVRLHRLN